MPLTSKEGIRKLQERFALQLKESLSASYIPIKTSGNIELVRDNDLYFIVKFDGDNIQKLCASDAIMQAEVIFNHFAQVED